jgi:hypothetical protein
MLAGCVRISWRLYRCKFHTITLILVLRERKSYAGSGIPPHLNQCSYKWYSEFVSDPGGPSGILAASANQDTFANLDGSHGAEHRRLIKAPTSHAKPERVHQNGSRS